MTPQRKKSTKKATSPTRNTAKKTKKATSGKKKGAKAKKPASKPRSTAGKRTLLTQTELARVFGVTTKTVQRWVERGLPREGIGRKATYPLEACIVWVREKDREEAIDAARPRTLEEARIRKATADAELAEYELGLRRKELMTLAQYRAAVSGAFSRVRAQLVTLENRLAPDVIGLQKLLDARSIVREHVKRIMQDLYDANDVPDNAEGA